MIGDVSLHRVDDSDVIDVFGRVFKQFADMGAVVAVLAELERRPHRHARPALRLQFEGQLFSGPALQLRFVVKSVHV